MYKIFLHQKQISVGYQTKSKGRYACNIYNTEYKLYILKLNGVERFPSKLFMFVIVR